jgi:hypothetical protein
MNDTNSDQDNLTAEQLETLAREASSLLDAAAERVARRELTPYLSRHEKEPSDALNVSNS